MRAHIPIVTLVLLLTPAVVPGLTAATANAEVIYVCWDGSGDYVTIQEGIDAAQDGDEVVVCDGVYTGPGNKNLDFGGKAITVRSANGPESCIINCQDGEYGFRFHSGETQASVVSGFTIMGADASAVDCSEASPTIVNCTMTGNGYGLTGVASSSAVVDCTISGNRRYGLLFEGPSCSPTISNCTITGNGAERGSDGGGGVYCYAGSATITQCHLSANTADCGGGVFCNGGSVTISNCTITANTARSGGAVFCYAGSHTISDSAITGNTASHGGGISCEASSPTIVNCTITANTVLEDGESYGGGIYCVAGSNPMISDCMIMGNAALFGGGVYCDDSSPTITNCVIAVNGDERCLGGGICCLSDSSPTITDCTIMGNTADYGGGFHCSDASPTIANCTIVGNTADGGGGVWCSESSLTIANCVIAGNTAEDWSGGGVSCFGTSVTISDCTITGNTATLGASGLACHAGSLTISDCTISENTGHHDGSAVACHENSPMIINCSITGNAGGVGALTCWGASPTITNCTISGNATTGVCCFVSNATITNCSITGNTGYMAGGVCCSQSSATISNCAITGNTTEHFGGGIWCDRSPATITNCTVAGNTTQEAGGGLLCTGEGSVTAANCILWGDSASQGPEIALDHGGALTVTYSDIEGGEAAAYVEDDCELIWGAGNIDADPLFVDPDGPDDDPNTWEDNDFHLTGGSPCIDAGCNWGVPPDVADLDEDGDTSEYTPFDRDGEGRFFDDPDTADTGCGCPPIVDMGAYEFGDTGPQPCLGDLDCDRMVGHSDLGILLSAWQTTGEGDLNCDGDTNHADLGILLGHWGEACP